jgi:hypothetical protein
MRSHHAFLGPTVSKHQLVLLFEHGPVQQGCQDSSERWCDHVNAQVGVVARHDSGTQGAGRVEGCTCERTAQQDVENQSQANGNWGMVTALSADRSIEDRVD